MAVYFAALKPGDTVLGMHLAHGGHLTHGHPVNLSGKLFKFVHYGVDQDDERIDYDAAARAGARAPAQDDRGRRRAPIPRIIDFARAAGNLPTRWGRSCWSTWPTSPGWWRPACTRARSRTPISSRPPPTRRCAGPGAAWCFARREYAQDMDRAVFPGMQGGPLMHVIAAKAVALERSADARI